MTAAEKLRQMTKTFVDVVHSETGFDVLIYDRDGRIVQATDEARVNDLHPLARKMIRSGAVDMTVTAREARENPRVREGYNRVIRKGRDVIAGFGVTGPLEITRPLGRMAAKIIDSWLDELELHEELENRVKERTFILKQEIEARKRAEKVLEENQARFLAFIKAIPDILFVFDRDGQYVEVFTSSKDLLLDDLPRMKGQFLRDLLPKDVAARYLKSILETAETGKSCHFEYELRVPKGLCWFESHTAPITGHNNLVAVSVRDITRRKLAEKEINEKDTLSAVIETAGAVSHEFNQPLQIITGACELLETYSGLDPEMTRIIGVISAQAKRMGEINKNLTNITSYKTKAYLKTKIIDIHQSAGD